MRDTRLAQLDTFKSDQAGALSDAQHNVARDLPPPPSPPYYLLLVVALIVVVAWHRRAGFIAWWRRWIAQPVTRKTTRNAGALKRWWLEK